MELRVFTTMPGNAVIARQRWIDISDSGLTPEEHQKGQKEYAAICKHFAKKEQEEREAEHEAKNADSRAEIFTAMNKVIEKIKTLNGLELEICGTWLWVGGETKKHSEALKAAGLRWASRKRKWYWAATPRRGGSGNWSMPRIRDAHGSRSISDED